MRCGDLVPAPAPRIAYRKELSIQVNRYPTGGFGAPSPLGGQGFGAAANSGGGFANVATQGGGFAAFAAPSAAGKLAHLLLGEISRHTDKDFQICPSASMKQMIIHSAPQCKFDRTAYHYICHYLECLKCLPGF